MVFKRFFIDRMVKNQWGFAPGKKVARGATIFDISLRAIAGLLVKHARRTGPIDQERLHILERVQGHFSEHVLFTEVPIDGLLDELRDLDRRYDEVGRYRFESEFDGFFAELAPTLPEIVRKLLLVHIAFFQRVDMYPLGIEERKSTIRDEHGLLLGSVSSENIEEVLNESAAYKLEPRQKT